MYVSDDDKIIILIKNGAIINWHLQTSTKN